MVESDWLGIAGVYFGYKGNKMFYGHGWYMEAGIQTNTFGDWAKLKGERSRLQDWQLSLLKEWYSSREPNDIYRVMNGILPEFVKVHKSLCKKVGIEENREWVDEILGWFCEYCY